MMIMSRLISTKVYDFPLIASVVAGIHELPLIVIGELKGVPQIEASTKLNLTINSLQIAEYLTLKYNDWTFFGNSEDDPCSEFVRRWTNIAELQSQSFATLLASIDGIYNPIENYDLTKSESTGASTDMITTKSTPDSNTQTTVSTGEEATFDGELKTTGQSTSMTDMIGSTNTVNSDKNLLRQLGKEGQTYASISDRDVHEHGNMGVRSVPEMIKSELDVRLINFAHQIIDSIAKQLLFYCGDGDD